MFILLIVIIASLLVFCLPILLGVSFFYLLALVIKLLPIIFLVLMILLILKLCGVI